MNKLMLISFISILTFFTSFSQNFVALPADGINAIDFVDTSKAWVVKRVQGTDSVQLAVTNDAFVTYQRIASVSGVILHLDCLEGTCLMSGYEYDKIQNKETGILYQVTLEDPIKVRKWTFDTLSTVEAGFIQKDSIYVYGSSNLFYPSPPISSLYIGNLNKGLKDLTSTLFGVNRNFVNSFKYRKGFFYYTFSNTQFEIFKIDIKKFTKTSLKLTMLTELADFNNYWPDWACFGYDFYDANRGFITFGVDHTYQTYDFGENWKRISINYGPSGNQTRIIMMKMPTYSSCFFTISAPHVRGLFTKMITPNGDMFMTMDPQEQNYSSIGFGNVYFPDSLTGYGLGGYLYKAKFNSIVLSEKDQQNGKLGLKVYPNPVNESIRFEDLTKSGKCFYEMSNAIGKIILNGEFSFPFSEIDISSLNTGTYNLKMTYNQQIKVVQIIKK